VLTRRTVLTQTDPSRDREFRFPVKILNIFFLYGDDRILLNTAIRQLLLLINLISLAADVCARVRMRVRVDVHFHVDVHLAYRALLFIVKHFEVFGISLLDIYLITN